MALTGYLSLLAVGGGITGIVLGSSSLIVGGVDGDTKSPVIQKVSPPSRQSFRIVPTKNREEKEQFFNKLENTNNCYPVEGEKKFGVIYTCSGEFDVNYSMSLYYLEEEGVFDQLDWSTQDPMTFFKKIEKFQYKSGGINGPYLSFNLGEAEKKIPVNYSGPEDWKAYSGFSEG